VKTITTYVRVNFPAFIIVPQTTFVLSMIRSGSSTSAWHFNADWTNYGRISQWFRQVFTLADMLQESAFLDVEDEFLAMNQDQRERLDDEAVDVRQRFLTYTKAEDAETLTDALVPHGSGIISGTAPYGSSAASPPTTAQTLSPGSGSAPHGSSAVWPAGKGT
jgi:hypothetical protein